MHDCPNARAGGHSSGPDTQERGNISSLAETQCEGGQRCHRGNARQENGNGEHSESDRTASVGVQERATVVLVRRDDLRPERGDDAEDCGEGRRGGVEDQQDVHG